MSNSSPLVSASAASLGGASSSNLQQQQQILSPSYQQQQQNNINGASPFLNDSLSSPAAHASSLEEMSRGLNEWRNIQDVVRHTFRSVFELIDRNSRQVRRLSSDLAQLTDLVHEQQTARKEHDAALIDTIRAELHSACEQATANCLAKAKIFAEERASAVAEESKQAILSATKPIIADVRQKLGEQRAQDVHLRDQTVAELNSMREKIDSLGSELKSNAHEFLRLIELKPNSADVSEEMQSKANKQTVSSALAKKANKCDVDAAIEEIKAGSVELTQTLSKKVDSEQLNQALESKPNRKSVESKPN